MRPIQVKIGPSLNSSATSICLSQTPSTAGALTLNGALVSGGVATMPASPQRVLITTADNTHTFTITGTAGNGISQSEVVTSNGTNVQSALDYATVTSIVISGGATAAVTVGTNGVASAWVRLDEWGFPQVSIQCSVTGTVNYTIQTSNDDPNSAFPNPPLPSAMVWVNSLDTNAVGATANLSSYLAYCPLWVRLLLNSGSGSVTMTAVQANVVSR